MLSVPVHILPGDHDMEQGSLHAFYRLPAAGCMPKSLTVRGVRCLFLDVCSPGKGGPDFRLGSKQLMWLEAQLSAAKKAGEEMAVFMHTYPGYLKDGEETAALNKLIADYSIAMVDMGHTHYNELANNGHTIFSATRSTGQIEEGAVGYCIVTIDDGIVSWRFKPLQNSFPLVVITTPADYRLIRKPAQAYYTTVKVRAIVFGTHNIKQVTCKTEHSQVVPMAPAGDGRTWCATIQLPAKEQSGITVQAIDERGWPGSDGVTITLTVPAAHDASNGSNAATIGEWPANGIFGTQLGPNRNAKLYSK